MNEKLGWILNIAFIAAAFAFGMFFGFSGLGAVALGWFVFDRLNKKNQWYISLIAGIISGLAGYFLLVFIILSLLD